MSSNSDPSGEPDRLSELSSALSGSTRSDRSAAELLQAQRVLAELLTHLEEPLRTTLVRHFVHGLDAAEIARIEGVPASTVRARLAHGVELLRAELERRRGPRGSEWHALLAEFGRSPLRSLRAYAASTPVLLAIFLTAAVGLSVWIVSRAPEVFGARGHGAFEEQARAPRSAPAMEHPSETAPPPREPVESAPVASTAATTSVRVDDETIRVHGRVLDEDGAPIPGAELAFDGFAPGQEPTEPPRTTADSSGSFDVAFALAPFGANGFAHCLGRLDEPLACASAPGFVAFARRVPVQEGRISNLGTFVLSRARSARGRVLDPGGRPLAGVRVTLARGALTDALWPVDPEHAPEAGPSIAAWNGVAPPAGALVAATDDDGRFVFEELLGGPHYLGFESAGFAPVRLAPVVLGRENGGSDEAVLPDVVLARDTHWLRVRIVDASGEPASSSYVALARAGEEPSFAGYTDRDGEFARYLPDDAPRDLYVTGSSKHPGTRIAREVRVGAEAFELVLDAPRFVQIQVQDREGRPRPGAWIAFHLDGRGWARFEPDHESTFVLRIPASRFDLEVFADGCESREILDIAPESVRDPWILSPIDVDRIRGRALREDGTPLTAGRALVSYPNGIEPPPVVLGLPTRTFDASPADETTIGPDGSFELPRRMPGPFLVSIAEVGGLLHESGPFEFEPGRDVEGLEVRLHEHGTLAGRVRIPPDDPARAELDSIFVGASSGDRRFIFAHVAPDGRFDFGEVTPGRWWLRRIVVESDGTTRAPDTTAPSVETAVASGAHVEVELDLERQLPAHVVGRATLDGAALAGWATSIELPDARLGGAGSVHADGSFSLRAEFRERVHVRIAEPAGARTRRTFERDVDFSRGADANADLAVRSARFQGRAVPLAGRSIALVATTSDGWTSVTRVHVGADGAIPPFRAPCGRGIVQALDSRGEPAGVVLGHFSADPGARDAVELLVE